MKRSLTYIAVLLWGGGVGYHRRIGHPYSKILRNNDRRDSNRVELKIVMPFIYYFLTGKCWLVGRQTRGAPFCRGLTSDYTLTCTAGSG